MNITSPQTFVANKCSCSKSINSKNIKHFPASNGAWFVEYKCVCSKEVKFLDQNKKVLAKNPSTPERVKMIAHRLNA